MKHRWSLRIALPLLGVFTLLLIGAQAASADASDTVGLVDPDQGQWHLEGESFFFGNPGDTPFTGDWNCDGTDTPGLHRQSDGFVYLRNSNTQGIADVSFFFGNPGDIPLAGDFNGDGCDTVSLYRPGTGEVFIINELGAGSAGLGAADLSYFFGNPGDKPFAGDFDGDGVDTIGLHRESTGLVYMRNSHTQGIADMQFLFGDPGDRFVGGDWTADGTDTPGVFRPTDSKFFLRHSNSQGIADQEFFAGEDDWLPVAGEFGLPRTFLAALSDEEVPGPGDSDGAGLAVVTISRGDPTGEVCFDISLTNVDAITAAHIHLGDLGTAGPIVVDFDIPTNGLSGCVSADQTVIDAILADPAGYYVNTHNAAFPPGAIRGQLGRDATLMAAMSDEETPGPGDADGTGLALVAFTQTGRVCFDITVTNVDPLAAAHIHQGALGTAGPIVVDFDTPTNELSGCVSADQTLIDDILADPAGYYVNTHNAPFPPGAVRGQLGRQAELMAVLSDQEVPGPGDADGTGLAVVTFSRAGQVCFDITVTNVDPLAAAHIHQGALGTAGPIVVDFDTPTNGLSGCVSADQTLIDDILADPAGYYVNTHNAPFPPGAVRGQLMRQSTLTATLSDEEVPGPGDADGTGTALVSFSRAGDVCFDITVSNVDPLTAAHIHVGALGTAGPIVVDFDILTNGLSGCVSSDQTLIDDILADPAGYYVNTHNAPFPPGAIRGQLSP